MHNSNTKYRPPCLLQRFVVIEKDLRRRGSSQFDAFEALRWLQPSSPMASGTCWDATTFHRRGAGDVCFPEHYQLLMWRKEGIVVTVLQTSEKGEKGGGGRSDGKEVLVFVQSSKP